MKLSEAIRLGSMLKPQGFGELCTALPDGRLATCAFGAANDAISHELEEASDDDGEVAEVYAVFRAFINLRRKCPACWFGSRRYVDDLIHHLNDDHRWTREQIADWVESTEQQQEQRAQTEAVTVSA